MSYVFREAIVKTVLEPSFSISLSEPLQLFSTPGASREYIRSFDKWPMYCGRFIPPS